MNINIFIPLWVLDILKFIGCVLVIIIGVGLVTALILTVCLLREYK